MNSPDRNSKPANSRTVLVLDDDVLVRMPVVQFLRDCGYHVVEAANTDEAITILQNRAGFWSRSWATACRLKWGLLVAVGSDGDDLRRAPPQAPPARHNPIL
jgi:CheY-like chemotaxis protein